MQLKGDLKAIGKLNANVSKSIQLMLMKIALEISNTAKTLAPYLSGTLRRSIWIATNRIAQGVVVVWSPVAYAKRREFENKLNPNRKLYLERWYTMNKEKIDKIAKESMHKALFSK